MRGRTGGSPSPVPQERDKVELEWFLCLEKGQGKGERALFPQCVCWKVCKRFIKDITGTQVDERLPRTHKKFSISCSRKMHSNVIYERIY